MYTILGAGLAGISASYHLGHENCVVYEKNKYATGHIHTEFIDGFTWDEGPHVSFTSNEYVKNLFAKSLNNDYLEYPVKTVNYYQKSWIPHPAQTNLFAIPEELRNACLGDFLKARAHYPNDFAPSNYKEWLEYSFGEVFSNHFPSAYTRKYWTTDPVNLTTDWVGGRVFFPNIEQVKEGYFAPLKEETHYIKKVRYPNKGGYMAYSNLLKEGMNMQIEHTFSYIDFDTRTIDFTNGKVIKYQKLVNTLPLPILIENSNAPENVKLAARALNCSTVLLINVTANHVTAKSENWIYVYDEDKLSTRINCTELLSPNNAPTGKTGIQVEVYFSAYKINTQSDEEIAQKVIRELIEMGLVFSEGDIESYHTKWIQWANVIFDNSRQVNQEIIFSWLATKGLAREEDDMQPMTNWDLKLDSSQKLGEIILAGRFGQWKYFWTDDCVLRGLFIKNSHS